MKNFKNLCSVLMLVIFCNGLEAQNLRIENEDGDDVITLSAENGSISSISSLAFSTEGTIGSTNYTALGIALSSNLNYGVTGYAPVDSLGSNAIYSLGDATITGNIFVTSDKKLKSNINEMKSVLDGLKGLSPHTYTYSHDKIGSVLPLGKQTGFLAQDVQQFFPHLVATKYAPVLSDEKQLSEEMVSFQAVNYIGMIPILWKGVQEQQLQIEDYQQQLDDQEERILRLEQMLSSATSQIESKSSEHQTGIKMDQNQPNPFRQSTRINYFVPKQEGKATLMVFDVSGQMIQSHQLEIEKSTFIDISLKGYGSGMYFYAILSKTGISSKKMIHKD